MDCQTILESYPRYEEINTLIKEEHVQKYVQLNEPGGLDILEQFTMPDIDAKAGLLHEMEELYQLVEAGKDLIYVISGGEIPSEILQNAHMEAFRREHDFLKYAAEKLGFIVSEAALAIANPRYIFSNIKHGLLGTHRLGDIMSANFETKPSLEDIENALEFFKAGGLDCEFSPKDIHYMAGNIFRGQFKWYGK